MSVLTVELVLSLLFSVTVLAVSAYVCVFAWLFHKRRQLFGFQHRRGELTELSAVFALVYWLQRVNAVWLAFTAANRKVSNGDSQSIPFWQLILVLCYDVLNPLSIFGVGLTIALRIWLIFYDLNLALNSGDEQWTSIIEDYHVQLSSYLVRKDTPSVSKLRFFGAGMTSVRLFLGSGIGISTRRILSPAKPKEVRFRSHSMQIPKTSKSMNDIAEEPDEISTQFQSVTLKRAKTESRSTRAQSAIVSVRRGNSVSRLRHSSQMKSEESREVLRPLSILRNGADSNSNPNDNNHINHHRQSADIESGDAKEYRDKDEEPSSQSLSTDSVSSVHYEHLTGVIGGGSVAGNNTASSMAPSLRSQDSDAGSHHSGVPISLTKSESEAKKRRPDDENDTKEGNFETLSDARKNNSNNRNKGRVNWYFANKQRWGSMYWVLTRCLIPIYCLLCSSVITVKFCAVFAPGFSRFGRLAAVVYAIWLLGSFVFGSCIYLRFPRYYDGLMLSDELVLMAVITLS